jgi:hypothetical protein
VADTSARDLGEILQRLKTRDGRSYSALAHRAGVSRSSLHRYCRGECVPETFGTVERLARLCGASRDELAELHRLWSLATAPAAPPCGPPPVPATPVPSRSVPASASRAVAARSPEEPRPRHRRARRAVLLVVAGALGLSAAVVTALAAGGPRNGVVTTAGSPQQVTGPEWSLPPTPVPPAFFGVTMNSATGRTPDFRVGGIRLWDSGTSWAKLQPRPGAYDWTALDRLVSAAERRRLPVLLTFGATPGWAAPGGPLTPYGDGSRAAPPDDLAHWDAFVRAVGSRYGDRIGAYELWNLAPSPRFFTGDASTLAEMTRRAAAILRHTSPRATIACPGMGELWEPESRAYLAAFARAGGYQHCDVASVKLHQRDARDVPETVLPLVGEIDRILRAEGLQPRMWNTGTTYRIALAARLDERTAANYAARFYLVGLVARYERMYFYNWGGTKLPIVLQAVGGAPTPAALAVERLQRWLDGAAITSCGLGAADGLPAGVRQCRFTVAGGEEIAVRWRERGTTTMRADARAYAAETLGGDRRELLPGGWLDVGEEPVLVRLRAVPS